MRTEAINNRDENTKKTVGFEVLTEVVMKTYYFLRYTAM
jgi:hypothetical protein